MVGKVFIASMNMRGKWVEPLQKNTYKLNVTSMQSKNNKNRINFSPMTEIVNGYKGYWIFLKIIGNLIKYMKIFQ